MSRGCGQLPVTALHVMDRTDVPELVLLDVSPRAIESVEALRDRFGWHRLQPRLADGAAFDFAGLYRRHAGDVFRYALFLSA